MAKMIQRLEALPWIGITTWSAIQKKTPLKTPVRPKESNITAPIPEVFTIDDLGRYLKIGRNGAYNLIHAGQIHYIRVGKQIRIPRRAVEDFLLGRGI